MLATLSIPIWGDWSIVRIIHVDDEPFVLEITKEIIQSFDREVEMKGSTSPKEAIELVKETEPDCVLSDFNMPEMDGIEFTRRLREHSMIPVVMYSNVSDEGVTCEAFEAGVDDFVVKQDNSDHYVVLIKRIRNVVDLHRVKKLLLTPPI
jgi:CheY-like chemotaxis protein